MGKEKECFLFFVFFFNKSTYKLLANSSKTPFLLILHYALIIFRRCQDTKTRGKIAFEIPRELCEKY